LWVPFYNFLEPTLFGFPFFYWYQLAWVPISSLLIWLCTGGAPPAKLRNFCKANSGQGIVMADQIDWVLSRFSSSSLSLSL